MWIFIVRSIPDPPRSLFPALLEEQNRRGSRIQKQGMHKAVPVLHIYCSFKPRYSSQKLWVHSFLPFSA